MPGPYRWMTWVAVILLSAAGCDRPEDPPTPPKQKHKSALQVVVPAGVKAKWKAVKIAVWDKATNQETVYAIEIGSDFPIPESKLRIKVLSFLPAFIMDGKSISSISNETTNPAAQVTVSEGEKILFIGWLFSLYPMTHSFQHPRFSFTLVGSLPAG